MNITKKDLENLHLAKALIESGRGYSVDGDEFIKIAECLFGLDGLRGRLFEYKQQKEAALKEPEHAIQQRQEEENEAETEVEDFVDEEIVYDTLAHNED